MKSKYRYLLKNIGLLTLSNFGSKILSFILIPLYTSVLSTAEYGTYDIYSTTISLLIPILTLDVISATMRFSLDGDSDKNAIFTIAFRGIILAIIIFFVLDFINSLTAIIPIFTEYKYLFFLLFCGKISYDLVVQFARGIERITDVAIAGLVNSVVMLGLNILFLLIFKLGLKGYFLANSLAYIVPLIYLCIRIKVWKYLDIRTKNKTLRKEMYAYSRPLIFNDVAWWVTNVSDRYIVTWICGVAANGIYSVAYKIPSLLNIFQTIFSQAWTLSAVKEFNNDSADFYSKCYKIYNCGMVIVCSILILADKLIAKILFANDFYMSWQYAPFLMISVVFGSLSGILDGIFVAAKKSRIVAISAIIGAVANIVLNIILVYSLGPIGAAISTLVSYVLVWVCRIFAVRRVIKLKISIIRDIASYFLLILESVLFFINGSSIMLFILQLLCFVIIIILYFKDFENLIKKLVVHLKKRKEQ